jgi:hypothetical protein
VPITYQTSRQHNFEKSRSYCGTACPQSVETTKIDAARLVPCMETMPPSIAGPDSAIKFLGQRNLDAHLRQKEVTFREEGATAEKAIQTDRVECYSIDTSPTGGTYHLAET